MTVLFFARRFYPLIGGVEKHVLKLSQILVKRGYKVVVITENYQSMSPSAIYEGIQIYRISTGGEGKLKKFRIWLGLIRYLGIMKSADVVHCHDIFFWYLPFRFIFPFKKVYTTFHGYEGNKIPKKKEILMHKIAEIFSHGNICVGNFYKKWYGTKATFVIYGATDKIIKFNKNINKNLIVFLGRLEEETGILEYLKAFKKVRISHKELQLVVLGDGSLKEKAKKYVLDNKLNVKFEGFVRNIDPFLQRAHFVFVSRHLGIIEALMNKKYVLSVYNNEIMKDYLEMTPFSKYISISSGWQEIRDELNTNILNESEKNIQINKGYEWVKNQTWENMTDLYLKLWF